MSGDRTPTRLFLASDRIWPGTINEDYPGARFVTRCRIASDDVAVAPAFANVPTDAIWGVLIETTTVPGSARAVTVIDDFGVSIEATISGEPLLSGDPESLFMASRYWELHPDFIQKLREVLRSNGLETADDEPRDDGALSAQTPVSP